MSRKLHSNCSSSRIKNQWLIQIDINDKITHRSSAALNSCGVYIEKGKQLSYRSFATEARRQLCASWQMITIVIGDDMRWVAAAVAVDDDRKCEARFMGDREAAMV